MNFIKFNTFYTYLKKYIIILNIKQLLIWKLSNLLPENNNKIFFNFGKYNSTKDSMAMRAGVLFGRLF